MISVKEQKLFTLGYNSMNVSLPQGAYVACAILRNGYVHISYLADDTKPYAYRKFICTGSFNDVNPMTNGKRCWYIDKIEMPDQYPNTSPYYYYILEVEQ
jgi:hypothetical protein